MNERPIPAIDGHVILRNAYYRPEHLRASAEWARNKMAATGCSTWEVQYLTAQIARIELALSTGRAA